MPRTGAQVRTDISMLKVYRFIPCRNYLLFYRIDEKNASIIRILYARRDYLGLLETDQKVDDDG
jgi:plasmid stabilization system protein ParE